MDFRGAYHVVGVVDPWTVGVSCVVVGSRDHGPGWVSSLREGEEHSQSQKACEKMIYFLNCL